MKAKSILSSEEYETDDVDDNAVTIATIEEGSDGGNLSNLIGADPFSEGTIQAVNDLLSRYTFLWPVPEGSEGSVTDTSSVATASVATFSVVSSMIGPKPDKTYTKAFFASIVQENMDIREFHKMLDLHPSLLRTRMKSNRRLPLHVICSKNFSNRVTSADVRETINGLLTNVTDLLGVLRTLAWSHPKASTKTDAAGDLPVHLLARTFIAWEEQWSIEVSPGLAGIQVNSFDIDIFTKLYQTMAQCIDLVLQPIIPIRELCRLGGSSGKLLPLHIGAMFGVSFGVFQQILEGYPSAAASPCELSGSLASCASNSATPLDLLDRPRTLPLSQLAPLESPHDVTTEQGSSQLLSLTTSEDKSTRKKDMITHKKKRSKCEKAGNKALLEVTKQSNPSKGDTKKSHHEAHQKNQTGKPTSLRATEVTTRTVQDKQRAEERNCTESNKGDVAAKTDDGDKSARKKNRSKGEKAGNKALPAVSKQENLTTRAVQDKQLTEERSGTEIMKGVVKADVSTTESCTALSEFLKIGSSPIAALNRPRAKGPTKAKDSSTRNKIPSRESRESFELSMSNGIEQGNGDRYGSSDQPTQNGSKTRRVNSGMSDTLDFKSNRTKKKSPKAAFMAVLEAVEADSIDEIGTTRPLAESFIEQDPWMTEIDVKESREYAPLVAPGGCNEHYSDYVRSGYTSSNESNQFGNEHFWGLGDSKPTGLKRRRRKILSFAVPLVVLSIISIVLGVTFLPVWGKDKERDANKGVPPDIIVKEVPPNITDQGVPPVITSRDVPEFDSIDTYKSQASKWLYGNADYETFSGTQKKQRFALACLYYNTYSVSTPFIETKEGEGNHTPRWITSLGWLSDTNECSWHGITCRPDGRVLQIELKSNRLTGNLPQEITLLADTLVHLDLEGNMLYNEGDAFLGQLTNLEYLNIASNDFVHDGIPSELGLLTNLKELDVSSTLYYGPLKGETFQNMEHLSYLSIGGNEYNSTIPIEIRELPSLSKFFAGNCDLIGDLSFLEPMTKILELRLDNNPGLTGSIPAFLGDKMSLASLSIAECSLTGHLPSELGMLTRLQYLSLYGNQLTGTVPREIFNLTNMKQLKIQKNEIKGTMPEEVCTVFNNMLDKPVFEADCVSEFECPCCTRCFHNDKKRLSDP